MWDRNEKGKVYGGFILDKTKIKKAYFLSP